jgi:hypothetical protein
MRLEPSPGEPQAFKWFGLPATAAESRLAALVGLALAFGVMAVSYSAVNQLAGARGVTVFDPAQLFVVDGRSLDSRIPYLPWTIVIYSCLWWLYLIPVLTYPLTESGARELFKLYSGLVVITWVACVVFIVCPAEMTLRAGAVRPGDSTFWHQQNQLMRVLDTPFNTWPCLHVAQPALIILMMARWIGRRVWTIVLWVGWVGLAISTMTVKQHFIWDVMTGGVLGLAYWWWKLRPQKSEDNGRSSADLGG